MSCGEGCFLAPSRDADLSCGPSGCRWTQEPWEGNLLRLLQSSGDSSAPQELARLESELRRSAVCLTAIFPDSRRSST